MDSKNTQNEFEEVFAEVSIEKIIFNSNPTPMILFLRQIKALIHPEKLLIFYNALVKYLNVDESLAIEHVRKSFGSHQMANFFLSLRNPLSRPEKMFYALNENLMKMTKAANFVFLAVVSLFFQLLDKVKDLFFLLIIWNTLKQITENGERATSTAEQNLWVGCIVSLGVTYLVVGLYCFINKDIMFKNTYKSYSTRIAFSSLLILLFPILPLLYLVKLAMTKRKMNLLTENYKSKKITAEEYFHISQILHARIEEMDQLVANTKILEGTLEAIPQLVILSSFIF